ncbi:MAG TPA: NUDIX hydrolase [Candidatus Nanoarchaeia archaeon]|nr:NUDIX hydrolase [Candidatus Nanoarchaeia archaeon]
MEEREKRYAASAIIYNDQGLVLLARRSLTKRPFPGVLSLPSTYLRDQDGNFSHEFPTYKTVKEQLEAAVKNKLGIDITLGSPIGDKIGVQGEYILHMADYFARFTKGEITPNEEDFCEALFADPAEMFAGKKRDKMGLCMQILLTRLNFDPDFWKRY